MEKEREKFRDIVMECTNDLCGMRHVGGREEMGVNGRMKWVGRWAKREELLRNGFREEIGITGTESGCETGSRSCKKE